MGGWFKSTKELSNNCLKLSQLQKFFEKHDKEYAFLLYTPDNYLLSVSRLSLTNYLIFLHIGEKVGIYNNGSIQLEKEVDKDAKRLISKINKEKSVTITNDTFICEVTNCNIVDSYIILCIGENIGYLEYDAKDTRDNKMKTDAWFNYN